MYELFIYFLGVVNGLVVLFNKGKLFFRGFNDYNVFERKMCVLYKN